jgi:hypothetical protein
VLGNDESTRPDHFNFPNRPVASTIRKKQRDCSEAARQAACASLTVMSNRDLGIDRYVRPMDSSSRFRQPCLGQSLTLASKGLH